MDRSNGDWLDHMYNPRLSVADFARHLQQWAERSAAARQSLPCVLDVPYGDAPLERLDIFPARKPGAPVLFFIHGGYWRALDKAEHSFLAQPFVEAGACVVLPNYTLCPAATLPQIVMQVAQALAWTWRHIAQHGGDPSHVVVAGHSAGGHLSAMMRACVWPALAPDLPAELVRAVLSISGLHDLEPLRHAPFLKDSIRLTPAQVAMASPCRLPAAGRGPALAVVGGDESTEFHRQNRLLRDAWGARRVPVSEALPGRNHFSVLEALAEPDHRLHGLARSLLGLS